MTKMSWRIGDCVEPCGIDWSCSVMDISIDRVRGNKMEKDSTLRDMDIYIFVPVIS